jgi:hypothetical protein
VRPEQRNSTAEIEEAQANIEKVRREIAGQMNTLEHKIANSIDWRFQFRRHPGAFLGTAAGLGYLIGRLL